MKGIVNSHFVFDINEKINLNIVEITADSFSIIYKNKSFFANVLSHNNKTKTFEIIINSNTYFVQLKNQFDLLIDEMGLSFEKTNKFVNVKSPMPGRVLEVLVKKGDFVNKGDGLVILEAMKMENVIKSNRKGVLKQILIKEGDNIEKNTVLLIYE